MSNKNSKGRDKSKKNDLLESMMQPSKFEVDDDILMKELEMITGEKMVPDKLQSRAAKKPKIMPLDLNKLDQLVSDIDNIEIDDDNFENDEDIDDELAFIIQNEQYESVQEEEEYVSVVEEQKIESKVKKESSEEKVNSTNFSDSCIENEIRSDSLIITPNCEDNLENLKNLALSAKKSGNIELAKSYLIKYNKLKASNGLNQTTGSPSIVNESTQNNSQLKSQNTTQNDGHIDYEEQFPKMIEFYTQSVNKSKEEGNSSKTRRMTRILQDFKTAYTKFKNNQPYNFDELPVPPGFNQLPKDLYSRSSNTSVVKAPPATTTTKNIAETTKMPLSQNQPENAKLDDEINNLKRKALEAKKAGRIDEAKSILLKIKSMKQPSEETKLPLISRNEEKIQISKTDQSVSSYEMIKNSIKSQLEIVTANINYLKEAKVSHLIENYNLLLKQLSFEHEQLRLSAKSQPEGLPAQFRRRFLPLIAQNPKVNEKTIHVTIVGVSGFSLAKGKELNSCISVSIPTSRESSEVHDTSPVKISTDSSIGQTLSFSYDPQDKNFIKSLKRAVISFKLKIPGGFFKKEEILATSLLKLDEVLENCTVSKDLPLMDPKKPKIALDGHLKVKTSIKSPIFGPEITFKEVNWLFLTEKNPFLLDDLDHIDFLKIPCLELMKHYSSNIDKKLKILEGKGNKCDLVLGKLAIEILKLKQNSIGLTLKLGGTPYLKDYITSLIAEANLEQERFDFYNQSNHKEEAIVHLEKRSRIMKEIDVWRKTKNV